MDITDTQTSCATRGRGSALPALSLVHHSYHFRGLFAVLRHGKILIGKTSGVVGGPMDINRSESLSPFQSLVGWSVGLSRAGV